jgi:hypothetical protein
MQFRIVVAAMAVTTLVSTSPVECAELPSNPSATTERCGYPLDREEVGGTRQSALQSIDVVVGSLATLALTVLPWPISWLVERRYPPARHER